MPDQEQLALFDRGSKVRITKSPFSGTYLGIYQASRPTGGPQSVSWTS